MPGPAQQASCPPQSGGRPPQGGAPARPSGTAAAVRGKNSSRYVMISPRYVNVTPSLDPGGIAPLIKAQATLIVIEVVAIRHRSFESSAVDFAPSDTGCSSRRVRRLDHRHIRRKSSHRSTDRTARMGLGPTGLVEHPALADSPCEGELIRTTTGGSAGAIGHSLRRAKTRVRRRNRSLGVRCGASRRCQQGQPTGMVVQSPKR